jgi:hypothetical protein
LVLGFIFSVLDEKGGEMDGERFDRLEGLEEPVLLEFVGLGVLELVEE